MLLLLVLLLPLCPWGKLFIYKAREFSLVTAGFLTAQYLQKMYVYEAFDLFTHNISSTQKHHNLQFLKIVGRQKPLPYLGIL